MGNSLGQYYTQDGISRLLVSKVLIKNPKKIIEIGVGDGSLVRVARDRWKSSKIIGGDIDPNNIKNLKTEFPSVNLFLINGLSSNLGSDLKIELGTIDIGICNPPYRTIRKTKETLLIIEACQLGKFSDYKIITSDLVFLAQNLLLIRKEGELAIILPDGLISSHQFKVFRKKLVDNYHVTGVIELPEKVFKKTEAKTHILIIRKSKLSNYKVPLYKSNYKGEITNKIIVHKDLLESRMDYSYHKWNLSNSMSGVSLKDLNAEIFRGQFSKKELELSSSDFIHTSDLTESLSIKTFKSYKRLSKKLKCAREGDIVISRVGKRCLERVLVIKSGSVLLSDCLYVIRVEEKYKEAVIQALTSEYGKDWIRAHAHGVCAKVISKTDLLNFVVPK